jgi:ribosomal protein S7
MKTPTARTADPATSFQAANSVSRKTINDAMKQGEVVYQQQNDGSTLVRFTVLKRALDQIEKDTQERIEKLSTDALEEVQ